MAPPPSSFCPHGNQPMKLVHTLRPLEPAWPALLAFYCAPCSHAEAKEHRLWRPGDFLAVQALGSMDRIEERSIGRVQECLDAAAHCEKRAASATDRTVQATFAEAAHCWRELARCWRECQSNAPTAEKVRA